MENDAIQNDAIFSWEMGKKLCPHLTQTFLENFNNGSWKLIPEFDDFHRKHRPSRLEIGSNVGVT